MKNRIKELRREQGLTLKELGKKLNIRDNALSQYETGKRNPQLGIVEEIANYFNVSIDYLLKETDKRDYPLESDRDAIDLLEKIKNHEIYYENLATTTALELAIWATANPDKIKDLGLEESTYWFIHQLNMDKKTLKKFSERRIKENKDLNKIDETLLFDDDYFGANANDVLTFMQESNRIGLEQTKRIISEMKNLPNYDSEAL